MQASGFDVAGHHVQSPFPEVDFDAADSNNIRVTGNVGADPELRETTKGTSVANLHMYVYQGKNNDSARCAFHQRLCCHATSWPRAVHSSHQSVISALYLIASQDGFGAVR